jgi:UDP-N-acetylglucosamine 2-epimerase (non-hydrolysing)
MHITLIAGARPNFMKVSPVIREILKKQNQGVDINYRLVHTGQHYDKKMSETFFEELQIPEPHINLASGSGTQAEQTSAIMLAFEKDLALNPTDIVIVVGDVTSTLACSIVAKKANIKLAHIEGGIRSYDQTMPEEINRKVTDSITDYFFTTTSWAGDNLIGEGIKPQNIFFVGNVMIDTLLFNLQKLKQPRFYGALDLKQQNYMVLTLHRPNNVDNAANLRTVLNEISVNSNNLPIIFPVHPRTKLKIEQENIKFENIHYVDPMGYLEFNYLVKNSFTVITDSGGITEETTVLGIPCMTIRDNTERPETCTIGTNELIGTNPKNIKPALEKLFTGNWKKGGIPELWDGKSAERIVDVLLSLESQKRL